MTAPVRDRLRALFNSQKEPKEVYGLLSGFLSVDGKLLRPALCLASCEAVGGRKEDALPAAAAIEMFHNFTLIHDDIEDCSKMRRGRPCLHVKHGVPLAINAGDGLFMMVWRETLRIGGARREDAQRKLLSEFTKVLEGQAVELGWYRSNKWLVDEWEYFQVVGGKTGALIAASCEVGGFMGGGNEMECRALYDFGMGIGIGFQIVDDVLNITGEEKKYGKEIGGDVREGKRTLLTIRALRALKGNKRQRLAALLKNANTKKKVKEAIALIKESGVVDGVMLTAQQRINTALSRLRQLPDTPARSDLEELAVYIVKRQR